MGKERRRRRLCSKVIFLVIFHWNSFCVSSVLLKWVQEDIVACAGNITKDNGTILVWIQIPSIVSGVIGFTVRLSLIWERIPAYLHRDSSVLFIRNVFLASSGWCAATGLCVSENRCEKFRASLCLPGRWTAFLEFWVGKTWSGSEWQCKLRRRWQRERLSEFNLLHV